MSDDKITTPTSSAGLMRFYDVSSSKFQIDPKMVVLATIVLIVFELLLTIVK